MLREGSIGFFLCFMRWLTRHSGALLGNGKRSLYVVLVLYCIESWVLGLESSWVSSPAFKRILSGILVTFRNVENY